MSEVAVWAATPPQASGGAEMPSERDARRRACLDKTAAELAGHSTIRHTEKYIHIVDELKRKAVDSLPPLRFDS